MGVGRLASADRAFERLYKRHVEDVYRYSLAVLANDADAEDVVQTTFLNAYRSYESGTRPKEVGNWLIAIAHNVCRQRFRTAARRPREVALDPDLTPVGDNEDEQRYHREDIQRALSALTFPQRSALAMRELEGRSYKEIAAALEVSESAVETLIFRARRAFREQLEGTITCSEAERALSRQLDGELPRGERGSLRAHLRECEECSTLARRFRAQRSVFKGLVVLPLPSSLASFSSGGAASGAALGGALGIKVIAFGSAVIVATGATTTEIVTHSRTQPAKAATAAAVPRHAAAAVPTQHATPSRARTVPTPVATHPLPAARRIRLSGHGAVSPARVVHPSAPASASTPAIETSAVIPVEVAVSTPEAAVKTSTVHETGSPSSGAPATSGHGSTHGNPTPPGQTDQGNQKPNGQAQVNSGNGGGKPADPGKSNADHGSGQPADAGNANGNGTDKPADQGKPADPGSPSPIADAKTDTPGGQGSPKDKKP
jgi:RNA polymerase sigma factor (sigma-70 family)